MILVTKGGVFWGLFETMREARGMAKLDSEYRTIGLFEFEAEGPVRPMSYDDFKGFGSMPDNVIKVDFINKRKVA